MRALAIPVDGQIRVNAFALTLGMLIPADDLLVKFR